MQPLVIKLKREPIGTAFRDDDWKTLGKYSEFVVCGGVMEELFEIPPECTRIDLVISDKYMAQSYAFKANKHFNIFGKIYLSSIDIFLKGERVGSYGTLFGLDDLAVKHDIYEGYVQVQI